MEDRPIARSPLTPNRVGIFLAFLALSAGGVRLFASAAQPAPQCVGPGLVWVSNGVQQGQCVALGPGQVPIGTDSGIAGTKLSLAPGTSYLPFAQIAAIASPQAAQTVVPLDCPTPLAFLDAGWQALVPGGPPQLLPPAVDAGDALLGQTIGAWFVATAGGAATPLTDSCGAAVFSASNSAGGEDDRTATFPIAQVCDGGAGWTLGAHITPLVPLATGNSHEAGLALRLSTTGSILLFTDRVDNAGNLWWTIHKATASNTGSAPTYTFVSENASIPVGYQSSQGLWFRVQVTLPGGTPTRTYSFSYNGLDWQVLTAYTETNATFLAPDMVGAALLSSSASSMLLQVRIEGWALTCP